MHLIIVSILAAGLQGVQASVTPPLSFSSISDRSPLRVRVRIEESLPLLKVSGFDLQIFEVLNGKLKFVASGNKSTEWNITCEKGRIQVQGRGWNSKKRVFNLKSPVSIQSQAGFLKSMGRPYREELQIYSRGSSCEVINRVELEKYLDGLVNGEFSAKWNQQSIEAQVVAARTYAYYQMLQARKKKSAHYDVDASVKDQVYQGYLDEHFHSSRAAEKTRGLILTVQKDHQVVPMKAFYHSTCGGKTELPEKVWGTSYLGFKHSVVCPYCKGSPRFQWNLDISANELTDLLLKKTHKLGPKARLLDVRVDRVGLAGRVLGMILVWEDQKKRVQLPISGVQFREWVGYSRLRSTAFTIQSPLERKDQQWRFQGYGNGHGVGMCQWGAKTMGEKGHSTMSILKYYYPDATLRKLW